jgi:SAM-dependent methyltransferase
MKLDATLWHGSFNNKESTLQQLSPYVGKLKTGMVQVLLELYSQTGDTVLDPFCGSGVVPLEAAIAGRRVWANDLSPYAYAISRAKLEAPPTESEAIARAEILLETVEREAPNIDLTPIPQWVKDFFHPDTLREIIVAFRWLKEREEYFLRGCLLGILHHVRPGFLSYPASHLVPYLRTSKYPRDRFPEMYAYRDLRSRLLAKIKRAYCRSLLPDHWGDRHYQIWQENAMSLAIDNESVDTIISSPPYFGALDYARDNRLRLWFLGCDDWQQLDRSLTAKIKIYLPQMSVCLREMYRVLKPGSYCILVLGDVHQNSKTRRTAELLAEEALKVTSDRFRIETIYDDLIPDNRRSRRQTKTTKFERILVMQKTA